jgi:mannose-6-phosphate isomerase
VVADNVASFVPKQGDAVLVPAGTVHSLGDVVVFEIQENSDVTFRLDDWGHVDPKTGRPRELQVDQALSAIDVSQGAVTPVSPKVEETTPVERERLFDCDHFRLWRLRGQSPFAVGAVGAPRILVCLEGTGRVGHGGEGSAVCRGDVLLLPAALGACVFRPSGPVTLLEAALPE